MKVSHLRSIPLVQPPKCGKWRKISILKDLQCNNFHISKNRSLINLLYYQNLSRILLFLFMHFVLEASSSCIDLSVLLPWPENQQMPSLFSLLLSFSIIRVMNDSMENFNLNFNFGFNMIKFHVE